MSITQQQRVGQVQATAVEMVRAERRGDYVLAEEARRTLRDMSMHMRCGDWHVRRAVAAARRAI